MLINVIITFIVISNYYKVCVNGGCNALKLMEGNKQISSNELCTEEHSTKVCKPYVSSFESSDLPTDFKRDTLAVEKPSYLNLEGLVQVQRAENNTLYPGVKITWRSPISEISRKYLEGYLLIWKDSNIVRCRMFQFNYSSPHLLKMITFSYEIQSLTQSDNINFTVYSFPTARNDEKNNPERFVSQSLQTFKELMYTKDSVDWVPRITTTPYHNGTIEVRFTLSPPEFNLTQVEVGLVRTSEANNVFKKQLYTGDVFSFSQQEGRVVFENLSSGEYLIQVNAFEPYQYVNGKCLCWDFKYGIKTCHVSCKRAATRPFYLNVTEKITTTDRITTFLPTSVATASVAPSEFNIDVEDQEQVATGESRQEGELSDTTVNILVIVAAALLIIVTVAIVCLLKKPQLFVAFWKYVKEMCSSKPHTASDQSYGSNSPGALSPVVDQQLPTLKIKKLYVMSADDHPNHVQIVESLINYLELHCYCQVVYPPRAEDIHKLGSPYSWFISHISTSDHIIFINSTGAVKLIEAHLKQMEYRDRELRAEEDLFTECLKHIYKDNKARDKLISIYFDSSQEECQYVTSPFNFSIPRNLPEFVLKLHGLNSKNKNKFSDKLPMLRENIPNLPAGAELLSSIKISRQYELNNPDWLKETFGEATPVKNRHGNPILENMISTTSADSGVLTELGLGSVSTPDLRETLSAVEMGEAPQLTPDFQNNSRRNENDLPLSIYTVPNSIISEDANNNRGTLFSAGRGISAPETNTTSERLSGVNTDAVTPRKGGAGDSPLSHMIDTQLDDHNNIYEAYDGQSLMKLDNAYFLPPETMSAVDNMSEAFSDVNKNNYFYYKVEI